MIDALRDSPSLQQGLHDFFAVFHECAAASHAAIEAERASLRAPGAVRRTFSQEQLAAQFETSREGVTLAKSGDWSKYLAHLQQQGDRYARTGVGFSEWYGLIRLVQRGITPHLVGAFGHDAARLSAALDAKAYFYDHAIAEIGDAFARTKEAALMREQEKLGATIASLHEAVFIASPDGELITRNPAAIAMTAHGADGRTATADEAEQYYTDVTDELIAKEDLPLMRALRGETVRDAIVVRRSKSRPDVYFSVNAAPILSADGTCFGAVASNRDITVRRQLDAERLRAATIEARSQQVAETSRLKSEFLANMSHELRTPLNSIIGFAELLCDGEVGSLEAVQHEFISDILKSGRHLLQLINDILDLSKVEAGRMQFHPQATSLRAVIEEAQTSLRTVATNAGVSIDVETEPSVDRAFLDPSRFKQVLYNFVSNALKFTPPGGRVVVRTRAIGHDQFCVEVEDSGIGISVEDQSRLFVEFEQLRTGADKPHGGTGLGLALTRRLVQAQGGSVGVRSELGHGSTFYAILPRFAGDEHHAEARVALDRTAVRHATALVIEDDREDARLIVETLATVGIVAEVADTGAAAGDRLSRRSFDVVTLGLSLRDTNAHDILRRIRADTAHRNARVVVVAPENERVSDGTGVDVIVKPIDPRELLAAVHRAPLAPRETDRGLVLVVENDPASERLVSAALERAELAFTSISAPELALERVIDRQIQPSAIILDLAMPTMDGFEFLRRLRSHPRGASVPVVVWSVMDLDPAQSATLDVLARCVVRKDGTTSAIVREVDALLRAAKAQTPEVQR